MRRFRLIIGLLGIVICSFVHAQQQHTRWFMGFGAGLDFSSGTPVATGGPLSTDEGCASIADSTGQLLFFTNGEQVWDRNQNAMPNGTGLNGSFSSSQSALIVPIPADPDRYYIFTTPAEAGTWGGTPDASYSIVDMSLNGGLGAVTTKNVNLVAPVAEKLTATRHANGEDVWVLVHEWNSRNYHAYLVTCNGVEGPVTSTIGYRCVPDAMSQTISAIGCMKLNQQGTRLASVWTHPTLSTPQIFESQVVVDVLEFDNSSGVLSNLQSDTIGTGSDLQKGYGVEFAPNGDVLYVNDAGIFGGGFNARIMQYDLNSVDPMNNEQIIASGSPAYGSMQLGPDGKIYAARLNGATYLSEIADPNVVGPGCDFMTNGASLGSDVSTWGLPNHWDTYPVPTSVDIIPWTDSLVCNGAGVLIETNWQHPFHIPTYLWSTGETTASIVANDPGIYTVQLFLPCSTLIDTVNILFGGVPFSLGEDVSMCEGDVLELSVPVSVGVLWSTGDTTTEINVSEGGTYAASITDADGCVSYDEVVVSIRNCDCPVYFPNAVTPNGDGNNELFAPVMDCEPVAYNMEVFDRWGRLLYATQDPQGFWDPSDIPLGVYVYRVRYSWIDRSGIRTDDRFGHITVVK